MFATLTDLQQAGVEGDKAEPHESGTSSQIWNYLVEEYTRLSITRETDRLPALSGIAAVFATHKDFQVSSFIAGLWSRNLPEALH